MSHRSRKRIRHPRRIALALTTLATALVAPCPATDFDSVHLKNDAVIRTAIDSCIDSSMGMDGTPGVALAVVRDHDIFYERGYGVRDLQNANEVDAHTRFRIASVTKIFTAAAVMQLVDQGLVQLDDFVVEHIPELRFSGRWSAETMTIRDLLLHTSSIFDTAPPPGVTSLDGLVGWLGDTRLSSPPGSFYNYAGPNYSLAGLVVERVSGLSFPDYLHSRVWVPASMGASTLRPDDAVASGNYATGYQLGSGLTVHPQDYHDWAFAPAGHGFSSAHDLALWARLMMNGGGGVLDPSSAYAAQRPQVWRHEWTGGHYGYGLIVERLPGSILSYHDGLHVGYVAYLGWIRSRGLAVALLANSNSMPVAAAANCIFQSAFDVYMPPINEPGDPSTWSRYEGRYRVSTIEGIEFPLVIDVDDEELLVTYSDPENPANTFTTSLENLYLDTFSFVDVDGIRFVLTFVDTGGRPPRIGWVRNRTYVGQREFEPRSARGRLIP